MPLDYKRNYKTKRKRRKIVTISIVAVVFLLASFSILYFKFWSGGPHWNPLEQLSENRQNTSSESTSVEKTEKRGMALERQQIHLYTIGVARIHLSDVNREYVRVEETVTDKYFDDALFIGDSRTEGFVLYSSLSNIKAYCSKGLSISRIYTDAE